jgi:DNA-directed RNA polymerase II subunit RPB3
MNPTISDIVHEDDVYKFRLSNINVSLANAVRRIILSEIPTYVFNTDNSAENNCIIEVNTSRLHNEIIKQRLGCIPIHRKVSMNKKEEESLAGNYIVEVDVTNDTDNIMYVTTEHFKLKNKVTGNYITEEETRKIFPKNPLTHYFIDFVRLRPKISDTIPGEKFKMTCEISVSMAKVNSMFNVVSICSYFNTLDNIKKDKVWEEHRDKLIQTDKDITSDEIEFQKKNFELLDAQRYYVPDSFDFTVQTVGVYDNQEIVKRGCVVLQNKFIDLIHDIDADIVPINVSESTMDNCYDIMLEGEDYTIGKVLEYILYETFYNKEKKLSYCGFKKYHPHDSYSIIRVAFSDRLDKAAVRQCLREASVLAQEVFTKLYNMF